MSARSFVDNCLKDPHYPFRKLHWSVLQFQKEKRLSRSSRLGVMSFSSRDQIIGRSIYLTGEFAFSEVARACEYLIHHNYLLPEGNGILLDIGANIGTICIPLLKRGLFTSALAFEPEPKNISYLKRNILDNALSEKIQVKTFGLSDRDARVRLDKSPSNFGDHRVVTGDASIGSNGDTLVEIAVRRLDGVLADEGISPKEISLIWMDTQGHEGQILKGGEGLFSSGIPLVTEYWPFGLQRSGTDTNDLCESLASHYDWFVDFRDTNYQKRSTVTLSDWLRRYSHDENQYTDLLFARATK